MNIRVYCLGLLCSLVTASVAHAGSANGDLHLDVRIVRLERVSVVFDGGSIRFDFVRERYPVLRVVVMDQNILAENRIANPRNEHLIRAASGEGSEATLESKDRALLSRTVRLFRDEHRADGNRKALDRLLAVLSRPNIAPVPTDSWFARE